MKVFLVRHGDALSAAEDPTRPLSPAGRAAVKRLSRLALERGVSVSVIRHSGILRAAQTASILAEYLAPLSATAQYAGLLPDDDPAIAKAEVEVANSPIMLVGHLPYMSRLASLLVTGDPERTVVEFSPPTMVCCVKEGGPWKIAWKLA